MSGDAWPKIFDTVVIGVPSSISIEQAVWRVVWIFLCISLTVSPQCGHIHSVGRVAPHFWHFLPRRVTRFPHLHCQSFGRNVWHLGHSRAVSTQIDWSVFVFCYKSMQQLVATLLLQKERPWLVVTLSRLILAEFAQACRYTACAEETPNWSRCC